MKRRTTYVGFNEDVCLHCRTICRLANGETQPSLRGKVKDWQVRSRVIGLLKDGGTKTVEQIIAGADVRSLSWSAAWSS